MQEHFHLLRGDPADGGLLVDEPLVHHVHGDLHRSTGGTLAVAGLEDVQLVALDGELDVLHVLVGLLEVGGNLEKLVVDSGHGVLELGDGKRGPDAGHHVLALGVHKKLAVEFLGSIRGVAGEAHPGSAVVAEISVDHGDDVDRRAEGVGDLVELPVGDGPGISPALEYRLHGVAELLPGIRREVEPCRLFKDLLELRHDLHKTLFGNLIVEGHAESLLDVFKHFFEGVSVDTVDHVAVHLDEAAVAVESETPVAGGLGEGLNRLVVEPEVEHRVHHAGHGNGSTGPDGHEEGILPRAERLSRFLLEGPHGGSHVVPDGVEEFLVLAVFKAGVGRQNEPLGNGKVVLDHLGQVGSLASQEIFHLRVAFFETVHILLCVHLYFAPPWNECLSLAPASRASIS